MPAQTVIKLRRDTAANWVAAQTAAGSTPILAAGELGLETDSGLVKYGDGVSLWGALEYTTAASIRTKVLNQTGSPITKGSVVYVNGANGDNPTITLADADTEATSSKTLGLVDETIANGAIGYVIEAGLITGLDTSTATAGQSVWLSSTAGQFVYGAPPAKPAHSVYLGVVVRAQSNNGSILVKVQNGYELEELHNVNIAGTLADNEVLAWDDASQMWINQTADEAGLAALSGATFTGPINGTSLTLSGDLTVNGTTTNINTQNLVVEDKNIIIGDVATPTDTTADGGGITLKGTTDKTFNWVDATDAWTSSEDINLAAGKVYEINGTTVLSSSQVLGKSVPTGSIVGTEGATFTGNIIAPAIIPSGSTVPTNGMYLGAANQLNFATNGTSRLNISTTSIFANIPFTSSSSVSAGNITAAGTIQGIPAVPAAETSADNVGYMGMPQNSPAISGTYTYTFQLSDAGKHFYATGTPTSATLTIPANTVTAFEVGTTIVVINDFGAATNLSIAINTDTLMLAGTGTTGTRTLARYGMATMVKVQSNKWIISGNGLS